MSSMPESAPSGDTTLYDYDTPNINALYNESVIFTSSYAGGPKCSPSRYSLLTGRYPSRCEFAVNRAIAEGSEIYGATISTRFAKLDGDDGVYNIANMLRNDTVNPYYTGMVGKWHLMPANDNGYNYGVFLKGECLHIVLWRNPIYFECILLKHDMICTLI